MARNLLVMLVMQVHEADSTELSANRELAVRARPAPDDNTERAAFAGDTTLMPPERHGNLACAVPGAGEFT
jgi:hypothetical protein